MLDVNTTMEAAGTLIAAVAGAYTTIQHVRSRMQKKKEKYRQDLLDEAKEESRKFKEELEIKIKALEVEFQAQKVSVSKDLEFFKASHNAEIKVLGEKIEALRSDISMQHQSLVNLLTKLVDR
jgi:hypothetical protein